MVSVSGGRWCRGNTHTNELWKEDVGRMDVCELPLGQLLAPTRWDTHASGLAFDRKKILLPLRLSQTAAPCLACMCVRLSSIVPNILKRTFLA